MVIVVPVAPVAPVVTVAPVVPVVPVIMVVFVCVVVAHAPDYIPPGGIWQWRILGRWVASLPMSTHLSTERIRRAVLIVALLNLAYFFVEFSMAVAIGSASLFADSADFLEDTAINLLIFFAVAWPAHRRRQVGGILAALILIPAIAAIVVVVQKLLNRPRPRRRGSRPRQPVRWWSTSSARSF